MNQAEQHNAATLEQSSETNQLIGMSAVLFDLRSFKVDYATLATQSKVSQWNVHSPVI
jgi:hypothetical protein